MPECVMRRADQDTDSIREMQKDSRENVLSALPGYISELEAFSSHKLYHHMLYVK
jgi:hypothetical protein